MRLGEAEFAIERGSAGTSEEQHERHGGEGEGVLRGSIAAVEIDADDSDEQVAGNHERGEAGKQAKQEKDAAEELGEGGDIAEPRRDTEGGDEVAVVVECAEGTGVQALRGDDLGVSMEDHGDAEHQAQKRCSPRLETAQPTAHRAPPSAGYCPAHSIPLSSARRLRNGHQRRYGCGRSVEVEEAAERAV